VNRVVLLAIGSLALVLGVLWFARSAPRVGGAAVVERAAAPRRSPAVVLAAPEAVADTREPRAPGGVAPQARADSPSQVRLFGRVVELGTGRPLGGLGLGLEWIETSGVDEPAPSRMAGQFPIVPLAPDGSFELPATDPERTLGLLVEVTSGVELEELVHRASEELLADGSWRVAAEVGFFARLEVVAPGEVALAPETALLTEFLAGEARDWPRDELRGRPQPFVRYAEAAFEAEPSHRRVLLVTAGDADDETWRGAVEIAPRDGFWFEPIRVVLQPPTSAHGRVLDEHGVPWEGAVVELLRRFEELAGVDADDLWEESDESGAFDFSALAPGEYRVRVCAPFTRGASLALAVQPGENDLGTLVLERGGPRVTVSGALLSRADEEAGEDPFALVTLRDPASGLEFVSVAGFELFQDPDGKALFEFPAVPRGAYELSVVPMDARRYPPAPLALEAPAAGIEIRAEPSPAAAFALHLSDARTAETLDADGLLFLRQGRWLPLAPAAEAVLPGYSGEPLVVGAPGHCPLRLDSAESRARPDADGARLLELALEPGFGRAILVRDLSAASIFTADDFAAWCGPALAGVVVLADGREVARSDGTGLALVGMERAPVGLTFELEGYRTVSSKVDEGVQLVLMVRE